MTCASVPVRSSLWHFSLKASDDLISFRECYDNDANNNQEEFGEDC